MTRCLWDVPPKEVWYATLASPYGLVLKASEPQRAMQDLYEARKALADPDLDDISIETFPVMRPQELWLVKRRIYDDDA